MNAIILAAGLGSRLHPHTIDRPKSMLEFGGQTLLGRLIKTFQDSGINDITVVTGYKSEKINLPNVNWKTGSINGNSQTKNLVLLSQLKFIDLFNNKGMSWYLTDEITRRRLVKGREKTHTTSRVSAPWSFRPPARVLPRPRPPRPATSYLVICFY